MCAFRCVPWMEGYVRACVRACVSERVREGVGAKARSTVRTRPVQVPFVWLLFGFGTLLRALVCPRKRGGWTRSHRNLPRGERPSRSDVRAAARGQGQRSDETWGRTRFYETF